MAELINLRQFKKARKRRSADNEAAGNRRKFGRAKEEKAKAAAEAEKTARDLDGRKRD